MNNIHEDATFVPSELRTKASEDLESKVQQELSIPDPENADAILKEEEEDEGESTS